MLRYALTRFASLAVGLVAASLVVFLLLEVVPGDPAAYMLGLNATPEAVAALRSELGLDAGPLARYLGWVGGMLQGDFGVSYAYRTPVAGMIADRLGVSLPLALYALGLSTLIAFPVGLWAASRRGTAVDAGIMGATQLGIAVPNFWFAMILVLIFAVRLRWVSAGGFPGWDAGLLPGLRALTLPAIALALPQASILARVLRSALLDTLGEDYVRTARAKGLDYARVVAKHAFRNVLIPIITVLAPIIPNALTGSAIMEKMYRINGIGKFFVDSITVRDYPMILSLVLIVTFLWGISYLISDILYTVVDPRIRLHR